MNNSTISTLNNFTSTTNRGATPNEKLIFVFENLKNIATCASLIIHLFYFAILAVSKSLHTPTFLYTNHANIASSFYLILSIIYIPALYSNNNNSNNNDHLFCRVSEILWMFTNYIRFYSILLVFVYRFVAVFRKDYYTKINESKWLLAAPICLVWFASLAIPIAAKYIFGTSPIPNLCLDGFQSDSRLNAVAYFVFNITLMILVPVGTFVCLYALFRRRLRDLDDTSKLKPMTNISLEMMSRNFGLEKMSNNNVATIVVVSSQIQTSRIDKLKHKCEKKFAEQLMFVCVISVLIAIGLGILQLRIVVPEFFVTWAIFEKIVKGWTVCNIAAIPLASIYYHPERKRLAKRFRTSVYPKF